MRGMLYVNSGYGMFGGAPGNVLLAFSVDGKKEQSWRTRGAPLSACGHFSGGEPPRTTRPEVIRDEELTAIAG